jgi:thiamine-phosphate pyrophosphorylase
MQWTLPPIYPITDKTLARRESHFSILTELVRGGARLIQIRDKSTPIQDLLKDLRRCVEFASSRGITLIVNDRCDLALSSGAMGVHLGQDDLPPDAARTILGRRKIIGFSAHSLAQVRKAQLLPIEYIGFGPVFPTATKSDAAPAVGLRQLATACKTSVFPVVAIGGIDLDQVQEVLRAGAASAAVISALMKAKNLARRMECFLEKATAK